jgi:hypothetical protein
MINRTASDLRHAIELCVMRAESLPTAMALLICTIAMIDDVTGLS